MTYYAEAIAISKRASRLLSVFLVIFAFSLAKVANAEWEQYAGVALGLTFYGSSEFNLTDSRLIYMGDDAYTLDQPFLASTSNDQDSTNFLASAYTGFSAEPGLSFALEVAYLRSSFGTGGDFNTTLVLADVGYDAWNYCDEGNSFTFFGMLGLGAGRMSNIQGNYVADGSFKVGNNYEALQVEGSYFSEPFMVAAAKIQIGVRYAIDDCSAFTATLGMLYLGKTSSITGIGSVQDERILNDKHIITFTNDSVLSGMFTIGIEMLTW